MYTPKFEISLFAWSSAILESFHKNICDLTIGISFTLASLSLVAVNAA